MTTNINRDFADFWATDIVAHMAKEMQVEIDTLILAGLLDSTRLVQGYLFDVG